MSFGDSYEFLKKIIGKVITIEELNQTVLKTDFFEPVDCYFLSDCIDSDKKHCNFNSIEESNGKFVINIDINFNNIEDFNIIKNMSWKNSEECNSMLIKIVNVYPYKIKN
ncbi:hypothetical protein [uncultured Clostridium sp.]|uniref:hypothetical protein n=1 Tax=uncultured Clostridium sp. TaxID=59620 RepID=UPI0028E733BF|nr:hypothetical protein [uncultured Clostridium sp.]